MAGELVAVRSGGEGRQFRAPGPYDVPLSPLHGARPEGNEHEHGENSAPEARPPSLPPFPPVPFLAPSPSLSLARSAAARTGPFGQGFLYRNGPG
jgi:hypothetical protein